jgi:hypothetical protein
MASGANDTQALLSFNDTMGKLDFLTDTGILTKGQSVSNLINLSNTNEPETPNLINLIVRAGGGLQLSQEIKERLHSPTYTT